MSRLLQETPEDGFEVEMLYDLAFAPGRGALSSYQLREGVAPIAELCTLIRDDYDVVVAAIRYWPVRVGERGDPALLLGPVAVHPTRHGEGLGAVLIVETLAKAAALGWNLVFLVGDLPYYNRFGFRQAAPFDIGFPKPVNLDRLLVNPLFPDAMDGVSGIIRRW